jgi:ubiquinone/menaquinone biosynthesis C-methylase UbiE
VLATGSNRTLLELRLDTGRKNQIRIHLSEKGFPLVGDRRFGAKSDVIGRLALHAAELTFTPPTTGQSVTFRSPAPVSFYRCVGAEPPADAQPEPNTDTRAPRVDAASGGAPRPAPPPRPTPSTAWENVAGWYDQLLEGRGNDHYHEVILPGALRLLEPRKDMKLLDIASGQGILCRRLAELGVNCTGIEASPSLVEAARTRSRGTPLRFEVGDARELDKLDLSGFDAASCIMALSNIDPLEPVMRGVAGALKPGGIFVWIITHPAFRAAGQTSWGWDSNSNTQYRRVDGYLSPGQKQIDMHPGKKASGAAPVTTWTFHRPLQSYIAAMSRAGLLVDRLEEWPSLRASTSGPRAAEENRTRREIPLFLGVRAVKLAAGS